MLQQNKEKLLPLLRFWCFGGEMPVLTEEMLTLVEAETQLLPFLWYFHHRELSAPLAETAHQSYRAAVLQDMRQEAAYREIARTLTEAQIPFLPVKGADLAGRVYPDSALRKKVDIDLFLSPGECSRAVEALKAVGWQTPYRYKNEHHAPDMTRKGIFLELHFTLPGFPEKAGEKLWQEMAGSPFPPPEWNLLLLFNHQLDPAECNGIKFLLDAGFLLKDAGSVDWEKIHSYARRCHVASPALFFAAFPDFFPEHLRPEIPLSDEEKSRIRKLFLHPLPRVDRAVAVMSDPERFTGKWWKQRVCGLSLSAVRLRTGNPKGHYGRLLWSCLVIFRQKLFLFWHHRRGDEKQMGELKEFYDIKSLFIEQK